MSATEIRHFIADYCRQNEKAARMSAISDYVKPAMSMIDTEKVSPDSDLLYVHTLQNIDPNDATHFIKCVKHYFKLRNKKMNGVSPNTPSMDFSECLKIKSYLLDRSDRSRAVIFDCINCHRKCIERYADGFIDKR